MKKLILRPWKVEDINSLVKYANNWNIAKFLTNQFPHPYTIEDGKTLSNLPTAINRFISLPLYLMMKL
nr:hypothetical protein [uncultured Carboxylicivirga sp.]